MATAKKPAAAKPAAPKHSEAAQAAPAAPEHHAMAARRGAPGQSYSVTDARGVMTEIKADADGVVQPTSTEHVRVADVHNLPFWSDPAPQAEAAAPGEPADESAEELSNG